MKRLSYDVLKAWGSATHSKPLLIRGARQTGKTWLARKLGEGFDCFLEINFEKEPDARVLFSGSLDPKQLLKKISIYKNIPPVDSRALIFFDEIQECPQALTALRYFYEETPEIKIIAAGSLLEFALESVGFPVGRVDSLYIYPMCFTEFLHAKGEDRLIGTIEESVREESSLDEVFHNKALALVGEYLSVGGMPEVVSNWMSTSDYENVLKTQDTLVQSYVSDFEKYTNEKKIKYVDLVFKNIPALHTKKFSYSKIGENLRSRELAPAFLLLKKAHLAHAVEYSQGQSVPLGAQANPSFFKALFFDIGLANRILGVSVRGAYLDPKTFFNNAGQTVEAFVGLELLASQNTQLKKQLYYWSRKEPGAIAELDYLIEIQDQVIPIEVKKGSSKKLGSLKSFLKERPQIKQAWHIGPHMYSELKSPSLIKRVPLYAIREMLYLTTFPKSR